MGPVNLCVSFLKVKFNSVETRRPFTNDVRTEGGLIKKQTYVVRGAMDSKL